MRKIALLGWIISFFAQAQFTEPVNWKSAIAKLSETTYLLTFEAEIAPKWHLYSQFSNPEGAIPTEFIFESNSSYQRIGNVKESEAIVGYDQVFQMDLSYFNERAIFQQQIETTEGKFAPFKVEINYQACDDKLCIFRTESFLVTPEGISADASLEIDEDSKLQSQNLKLKLQETQYLKNASFKEETNTPLNLFLLGFFGGLLALLTPCVFPMIPLTVSFFLKQATTKSQGIFNALLYTFFIILIYVLLSLPFHFIDSLNPEILNNLATNVALNLIFFIVFLFFAFSFFGFYELTLPTSWGSKADEATAVRGGARYFLYGTYFGYCLFFLYRAYFGIFASRLTYS